MSKIKAKSTLSIVNYQLSIIIAIMLLATSCGQSQSKTTVQNSDNLSIAPEEQTGENVLQKNDELAAVEIEDDEESLTPPTLSPEYIDEFARPYSQKEIDSGAGDGTYNFQPDPNGKYYHYESFVGDGNSQWDAIWIYEEKFTATSTLAPSGNTRYDAENLRNDKLRDEGGGDRTVAWCEGVKGYGIGERITMSVRTKGACSENDDKVYFYSLMIVNGYAKDETTWKNNSRVKLLRLYVGDKHWCDLHLTDTIKPQLFMFYTDLGIFITQCGKKIPEKGAFSKPPDYSFTSGCWYSPETPVYQTDLTFEILEVYPGDKYDDTCITGIALNSAGGIY